jgi:hypothetical protein
MPWLWVGDADWARLMQTVNRIDQNTRHLGNYDGKLNALLAGQETGRQYLETLKQMEQQMAIDLTAANAEIARNTDLVGSIKAAFAALTAQVADLKNRPRDPPRSRHRCLGSSFAPTMTKQRLRWLHHAKRLMPVVARHDYEDVHILDLALRADHPPLRQPLQRP